MLRRIKALAVIEVIEISTHLTEASCSTKSTSPFFFPTERLGCSRLRKSFPSGVSSLSVGKKKGEVDLVLQDASVSRMHARITNEEGDTYLEDLNSTNGSCCMDCL